MIRSVIFDFDGVVHDTFAFHLEKIREFSGVVLTEQEFRDLHNGNFHEHTNDKVHQIDWPNYGEFAHCEMSKLEMDEEVRAVLEKLHEKYQMFIVSSGQKKNIMSYFSGNFMGHMFQDVLAADHHLSKVEKFRHIFKKYEYEPDECVFVTDTLGDILEANVVNIKTIAVDYGFHDRDLLERGNPSAIISNFSEIPSFL